MDLPAVPAAMLAIAQGRIWQQARGARPPSTPQARPAAMPSYANPVIGEGPLGEEDQDNFHP
jgi:hypothetical protein